jgi:hypothetical protein
MIFPDFDLAGASHDDAAIEPRRVAEPIAFG